MNYDQSIDRFAERARGEADMVRQNPLGFFVAAMMAGAYVGIGILLIFSVGEFVDPSVRRMVMGASFGIALTLVVFAGSELFTGHTMYMTLGLLRRLTSWKDLGAVWSVGWIANLLGSFLLGALFVVGGSDILGQDDGFLYKIAAKKMSDPPHMLVARAILCNWLVCLALWTCGRTENDTAKCILIFWCLYAFIASGFEHSVANMTIFSVALLSPHPETITVVGAGYNLLWVTIGNVISGAIFVGVGYWIVSGSAEHRALKDKGQRRPAE